MGKQASLSSNFDTATATLLNAAREELVASAKAHNVRIRANQIIYTGVEDAIAVHAPLVEIERYGAADFAAGVPILMIVVKSNAREAIPNGAYIVRVQHKPGATTGTARFADRSGKVIAERALVLRTRTQTATLFPDVDLGSDTGGPVSIPVITSGHAWGPHKTIYVDCAGWQPFKVLYFHT